MDEPERRSDLWKTDSSIRAYAKTGARCKLVEARIQKADILDKETKYEPSLRLLKIIIRDFPPECDSSLLLDAYRQLTSTNLSLRRYDRVDSVHTTVRTVFDRKELNSDAYFGILNNRAYAYFYMGKVDSAIRIYHKMKALWSPGIDSLYLQLAFENLGGIYGNMNRMDSTTYYTRKGIELAQARGKSDKAVGLMINLANINSELGRDERVIALYSDARDMAKRNRNLKNLSDIEYNWAIFHYNRDRYDSAFVHLKNHLFYNDSLLNAEKIRAVAEAEQKYEAERRKRLIEELKVQNLKAERTRNYFILGGIVLLLASIGLWWRVQHVRKTRRKIEKEKDRSDELLLNILPEEIADELKATGTYNARRHPKVSIMFADFKDFTQTSEMMSAEELVEEIDYCFKAFDKICAAYDLEKIKTIGDCYMAASGLPTSMPGDTEHIVQAALEMQDFLASRKHEREQDGQLGFDMRIGIHSGPVVAGVVGSDKFSYDIWGDTVNTAARMESSGAVGKVNISQVTYDLIKDHELFCFEKRGEVYAKHKGEIKMYFVEYDHKTERSEKMRSEQAKH